jgi:hypothetical protein
MKKIHLEIDDQIIQEARNYALSRNTTLNALVREHLQSLVAKGATELPRADLPSQSYPANLRDIDLHRRF